MKITLFLIILTNSILSQWAPIFYSQNRQFAAVYFCNSNTGFTATATAVGPGTREIYKTVNGGISWQSTLIPTPYVFYDIVFINCMTGYTVGVFGTAFKTTNNGNNWFPISIGTTSNLQKMQFINENTGFIVGTPNIIRQTTNSGETWLNKDYGSGVYYFNGLHFININTGYVVGHKAGPYDYSNIIIKTSNAGFNWNTQNVGILPPYYLNDVNFMNESTGLIIADGGKILRTTNGGINWIQVGSNTTSDLTSIFVFDQNNIWVCGHFIILKSSDSGLNWSEQYYDNNFVSLLDIFFTDVNTGYSVGLDYHPGSDTGIVLKTTNGGISFVNNYGEIPINFLLYQNYPNPFNPSTTIQFDLPKKSIVKLTVYDITGKQIDLLVNGELQDGTHEYRWNAGNFPSGVYFYKLETEKYEETRKMIKIE